ncbi:NAD-dependent formate dehydrogenase [Hyphomicrobium nitrativorans NL23]|uniref:NAD-dependent formate dehydrogenase n=1 Tax=Hyphomicrobium nitrativorans NL23 TaxID=1029756 RepID=V5SGA8_9HYPH|nr:NAD-dependent formate dehydrogenase [Hyphomicrobium nitrativorans NL23]
MSSPADTLIRMANDIGKFFRSQGGEKAILGISNHIKLFWEPRMKKQIFAHLDHGGEGLDPLTLQALQKLKTDMAGKSTAAEAAAALKEMAEVGPDLVLEGSAATKGKSKKR